MRTVSDFLNELKTKKGSDYKAAKAMNVDRSVISSIRTRNAMSEENAVKVAELLNEPEEKLLVAAAIARNSGKAKEAWERVAKTLGYMMVFICFTSIGYVKDGKAATSHNAYYVKYNCARNIVIPIPISFH